VKPELKGFRGPASAGPSLTLEARPGRGDEHHCRSAHVDEAQFLPLAVPAETHPGVGGQGVAGLNPARENWPSCQMARPVASAWPPRSAGPSGIAAAAQVAHQATDQPGTNCRPSCGAAIGACPQHLDPVDLEGVVELALQGPRTHGFHLRIRHCAQD